MTQAGDAIPAVKPGEGAPTMTAGDAGALPTQKQGLDPDKLPADVMAAVNARIAKEKEAIVTAERKRWDAEQEQKAKDAEMSELEKERAARKKLETEHQAATAALETERRRVQLRDAAAAKGLRSAVYVEHVLTSLGDADFDADFLADKALALYNADHGPPAKESAAVKRTAAPGGTPTRAMGDLDLSRMTSEEVADHARTLGPFKGPAWLNTDVRRYRTSGGRLADER